MISKTPRLLLAFLIAVQLPSARADVKGFGGGWVYKSNSQCFGKKNKEVSMLSCEEGLALKESLDELEKAVASLNQTANNLKPSTPPESDSPVVMLSPIRGGAQNCVGENTGPCGVGLTIRGVTGLVCFPTTWTNDQQVNFARAVLPTIGAPSDAVLVNYYDSSAASWTYQYGADYFSEETGLPGQYWNLDSCSAADTTLDDYVSCANQTTFQKCSVTYQQRFFTLMKTP